jgi:regulatory protein YycI of two-component signal transduction system YycFG
MATFAQKRKTSPIYFSFLNAMVVIEKMIEDNKMVSFNQRLFNATKNILSSRKAIFTANLLAQAGIYAWLTKTSDARKTDKQPTCETHTQQHPKQ